MTACLCHHGSTLESSLSSPPLEGDLWKFTSRLASLSLLLDWSLGSPDKRWGGSGRRERSSLRTRSAMTQILSPMCPGWRVPCDCVSFCVLGPTAPWSLGIWVASLLLEVPALSLEVWSESLSKEALLDCSWMLRMFPVGTLPGKNDLISNCNRLCTLTGHHPGLQARKFRLRKTQSLTFTKCSGCANRKMKSGEISFLGVFQER